MTIISLHEIEVISAELTEQIKVKIEKMSVTFELQYLENEIDTNLYIIIKDVLRHKYTSERLTPELLSAYDTLVEIIDSDWLKELRELNRFDYNFWRPRHFAIYLENLGMYQFIARDYEIIYKDFAFTIKDREQEV